MEFPTKLGDQPCRLLEELEATTFINYTNYKHRTQPIFSPRSHPVELVQSRLKNVVQDPCNRWSYHEQ